MSTLCVSDLSAMMGNALLPASTDEDRWASDAVDFRADTTELSIKLCLEEDVGRFADGEETTLDRLDPLGLATPILESKPVGRVPT